MTEALAQIMLAHKDLTFWVLAGSLAVSDICFIVVASCWLMRTIKYWRGQ